LRVLVMDWGSGNTALAEYSFRQITSVLLALAQRSNQRALSQ